MDSQKEKIQKLCSSIATLLEDVARLRASGIITEQRFVELLLKIEAEEVAPVGFTLTASNTSDDWIVFQLRAKGCSDSCASFEFLPERGEFRQPGSGPD